MEQACIGISLLFITGKFGFFMASKREKIKMKSAESSSYYYTTKNKITVPGRLALTKYCPILRRRVEFKETK